MIFITGDHFMFRSSRAFLLFFSFLSSSLLHAQGLTGQLSGSVTDPSGASLATADVSVANVQNGQSRTVKTDQQGHFVVTELLPGTFTLEIAASGFKKYEQREIIISATERVTLPPIVMQVGALSDTVSVTTKLPWCRRKARNAPA